MVPAGAASHLMLEVFELLTQEAAPGVAATPITVNGAITDHEMEQLRLGTIWHDSFS